MFLDVLAPAHVFDFFAPVKLVTDYDAILNDNSINCVVELMGGITDAKEVNQRQSKETKRIRT